MGQLAALGLSLGASDGALDNGLSMVCITAAGQDGGALQFDLGDGRGCGWRVGLRSLTTVRGDDLRPTPRSRKVIDHVQGLRVEVDRVRAAVGDLDARVPACPDWRVRDLLHHLGTVHRRFRHVADDGWMQRPPDPDPDDRPSADDDRIVEWADHQAELLLVALTRLDPEAPRWNFSRGPQVGAFIPRRMHHETAVHRWDLEGAQMIRGVFDDEVASDGIREYLEVTLAGSGRWTGAPANVHTVLVDGPNLELELSPDAWPVVREDPRRTPDAVVAGTPEQLLLAWWGRAPLSALCRAGDATLIAEVRRFART